MRVEMDGQHNYSIKAVRHNYPESMRDLNIEWEVRLPHQCDEWSITGHATSKTQAIERLEGFIAEAQATLTRLKQLPENAHDLD